MLLKNSPIWLLDEATSSLESETENEILEALEHAGRGRIVITFAHRLFTISRSDKIVVLDKGIIVETGKHIVFLEKRVRYSDL